MVNRTLSFLLTFAFAVQAMWCFASSQGILLHRHGAFGFHAHMLYAQDDAVDFADSARWGHGDVAAVDAEAATDVIVLHFNPVNQSPWPGAKDDTVQKQERFQQTGDLCDALLITDIPLGFAGAPRTPVRSAHGHASGIRGILESNHAILI